jgi:hypothetical protein
LSKENSETLFGTDIIKEILITHLYSMRIEELLPAPLSKESFDS